MGSECKKGKAKLGLALQAFVKIQKGVCRH